MRNLRAWRRRHPRPWLLSRIVTLASPDGWHVVGRREQKGVVVYLGRGWFGPLQEVGRVGYDRTDRPTSFDEQLDIVVARANQRAKVADNHEKGLI